MAVYAQLVLGAENTTYHGCRFPYISTITQHASSAYAFVIGFDPANKVGLAPTPKQAPQVGLELL